MTADQPADLTVFPDAELAAIQYLRPILARYDPDIPLDVRGAGQRFVRVRRVGGVELSPGHDNPTVDVLVWHDSDQQRMALAQYLWGALRSCANAVTDHAVVTYADTVIGPGQMPDPADDTKTVCLFTVNLIVRAR